MKGDVNLLLIDLMIPSSNWEIYFSITLNILKNKFTDYNINTNTIRIANEFKNNNFEEGDFYKNLLDKILKIKPTHIGFTTIGSTYVKTIIAAKKIKKNLPNVKIFLGGPQASLTATKTLTSFPFIDFILYGEAEGAIKYLSDYIKGDVKPERVPNLIYRENNKIVKNKELNLLGGEELPEVIFNKNSDKTKSIRLEGGRGCPFNCVFCSTSTYWKKKFRIKPIDSILEEIRKNDVKTVHITHDLFTLNKDYLEKFCKRIKEEDINWSCSSRADTLTIRNVDLMEKSNCSGIFFGIETGDQEMQRKINKNLELKKVDKLMESFTNRNLTAIVSFIFGFPENTPKSVYNTIKKIFKYKNYSCEIRIFTLKPFAGSSIYDNYIENLFFDEFFYKNSLNYNLNPDNYRTELQIIQKYPSLFSAYYRIKPEPFNAFFILEIKLISEFLLKSFPKTFFLWLQKFNTNPELFFQKLKKIMSWKNKYKITKKELSISRDGDYIIMSFIKYFESNDEYIDKKIKETFRKEFEDISYKI